MAGASLLLANKIQLALHGSAVGSEELVTAVPDPSTLKPAEKAAWIQLQNWDREESLRSDCAALEHFSKQRMQTLLERL